MRLDIDYYHPEKIAGDWCVVYRRGLTFIKGKRCLEEYIYNGEDNGENYTLRHTFLTSDQYNRELNVSHGLQAKEYFKTYKPGPIGSPFD